MGFLLNVAAGPRRSARARASIPFFVAHHNNLLDLLDEHGSSGEDNGSGSGNLSGDNGGTGDMLTLEFTQFSLINENSRRRRRDWSCNQAKSRSKVCEGGKFRSRKDRDKDNRGNPPVTV